MSGDGDAAARCLLAALALAHAAAWTVDLEAVRRFFDNQKKHDEYQQHLSNYYGEEFDEYDGAPEGPRAQYAEEYGYEGYMERKVHGVVRKGGKYLDGLRLALENYKQTLENCTLQLSQVDVGNVSRSPVRWSESPPGGLFNGSTVAGLDASPQWPRILNLTASVLSFSPTNQSWSSRAGAGGGGGAGRNLSRADLQRVRCANATREREHVRRLVDLALYTTRQLQDRAMKEMIYAGHPGHDGEERELIIRLAWFLDRLAHITGYEPEAKSFVDETERTSSTTGAPPKPPAVPVPEDVKRQMIECVKKNSSLPAALRCSFPFQLSPMFMMALNMTGNNITSANSTSANVQQAAPGLRGGPGSPAAQPVADPDKQASNLLETLFIVTDMWSKLPPSPHPAKSAKSARSARSVRKRSLDNPVRQFMDYYLKQKAWIATNAKSDDEKEMNVNDYSVDNDLTKTFKKRSESAGQRYLLRMPKDQHHKVSHRKYKAGGAREASGRRADKVGKYLAKVRGAPGGRAVARRLGSPHGRAHRYHRSHRAPAKRSVLVRESEGPMQDISHYVKNKRGRNIAPSVAQQLRVRLALESIFQSGNMEVVRRYGANYSPLVPNTSLFGNLKTISDI